MLIIDAQVHIWQANSPQRPWPAGRHAAHRPTPITAEDLIVEMNQAGVDAAVLVPPSWEGERNDLVLAASAKHPERFVAMGRVDPDDPAASASIASWRAHPRAMGLRFAFHRAWQIDALNDGRLETVWASAAAANVPVMILIAQARLDLVAAIAERHPRLSIVLDHLAVPSSVPLQERFTNLHRLTGLERYPNIAVKASALPCLATDEYPYRSLHDPLRRVIDAFGPQRVLWGSDLSRLPCTYQQAVTMFTEEMPWLSSSDLALIMGRAINERFGLQFQEK